MSQLPSEQISELESLLLEWEDGQLDAAGISRVRDLLNGNPEARSRFVEWQMLSAGLRQSIAITPAVSNNACELAETSQSTDAASYVTSAGRSADHKPDAKAAGSRGQRPSVWPTVAVLALFAVLAGRLVQLEVFRSRQQTGAFVVEANELQAEPRSRGVAVVSRLVDVHWGTDAERLEVGDALPPGPIRIPDGFAQIEFFCGASVVIEGPAELQLETPLRATVTKGRLRASVPPAARGFTLLADGMQLVDLGTEFGVDVSDAGTQMHVFDGEVRVEGAKTEDRVFRAGEALTRSRDGRVARTASTATQFVDTQSLRTREAGQDDQRYRRWREWSQRLRRDPRLIVYYAFDEDLQSVRRLHNRVVPENGEFDGAVVGAEGTRGRWPAKSALEFKRPGDRVRVQIPGEFGSLSFACWVRIDSLDRRYNSLFLTDNYNKGEPHWQILQSGQLYFSVRPAERGEPGPTDFKVLSPSFWNPSLSGRWIHLATVFDIEHKTITHYLNGEVLNSESVPEEQMVAATCIGTASVGNWSLPTLPDASFAIRNLNGCMDEFVLFAAALTKDEIQDMYEHGRP